MKKRFRLVLVIIGCSSAACAQFQEKINSGRPGQSIGAFAVGKHLWQIQSGINHFRYDNGSAYKSSGFLSNNVLRYGITETFELGGVIEYRGEEQTYPNMNRSLQGWSDLQIGLRYTAYRGHGLVPNVGLQLRGKIPVSNGDYTTDHWAPVFTVVLSQKLSERFTLITNWGASWNGISPTGQGNYTANLSYALSERFGLFIENYGSLSQSDFDTYLDGGLAWLLHENLQLDIFSGYGSNDGVTDFFVSTGISVRKGRPKQ